jgi:redox-sensitive bicupin YhaK (pirin superfamily)
MTSRTIKRAHPAMRDDIADLTTRRPVPGRDVEQIDPFLFLNHHGPQVYAPRNRGLPFGPHPHRGFETVTFILTGELAHRDSAGHESVIKEGGIQWMTAGSGLVHAEISPEEFMRNGGPLEILQLWVNLPPRLKMTQPRYIGLQRDEIPAIPTPDGKGVVNLVSGEYLGRKGAMEPLLDIFMSTVELKAGARVEFTGVAKRNVFLYVVRCAARSRSRARRRRIGTCSSSTTTATASRSRPTPKPCCCSATPSRSARPSSPTARSS